MAARRSCLLRVFQFSPFIVSTERELSLVRQLLRVSEIEEGKHESRKTAEVSWSRSCFLAFLLHTLGSEGAVARATAPSRSRGFAPASRARARRCPKGRAEGAVATSESSFAFLSWNGENWKTGKRGGCSAELPSSSFPVFTVHCLDREGAVARATAPSRFGD